MIRLLCILLCLNLTLLYSQATNDSIASSTTSNSNPPLLSPPLPENSNSNSNQNQTKPLLKPSIHIIVGAIISAFSITFLIFLYIKHCKTANNAYPNTSRTNIDPSTHRKNSGIDPNIIDLLPVFRFSSLKGQKDGLECAVCLTNYEPTEVLRLLPKCKHAFHVECLDTWLDAHSTCPLCRHRVEPEDVLLIEHNKPTFLPQNQPQLNQASQLQDQELIAAFHRTSGRHSSAGEKVTTNPNGNLQITVQKQMGSRLSLDSSIISNKQVSSNSISLNCFEKPRKDQLLLDNNNKQDHRLHHRIIISSSDVSYQRWSDVRPSDLLYIKSEMLMSESRRVSAASDGGSGKMVNKERSVSEIISRKRGMSNEVQQQRQRQQEGFVSRWLAWVSDTKNHRNNSRSNITTLPPPVLHATLDP